MEWTKAKNETQNGPALLHKSQKRFTRETKMSPRGPSGALKSLFKNLKKPCVFTRFLGPETSQETLKKPKSRKCAKNAAKKT